MDFLANYFSSLNPMSFLSALPGNIAQGIIWGLMGLGVFLTFKLLNFADLSVDGSFATGGAVTAVMLIKGCPVWATIIVAILAGLAAGLVTGLLHTLLGIPDILAGILTQIALYSINLNIMGKSNLPISYRNYTLVVSASNINMAILVGLGICAVVVAAMYWYFGTEQGSTIRSTGSNPAMSKAQGININFTKVIALALSNGLVALSGSLFAQYQGFADINMGRGAIVIGLAAVIIGEVLGEAIFRKHMNFIIRMLFVIVGGILYYIAMGIVLWLKMPTDDTKLFTAIIVAIFLAVPYLQKKRKKGTVNEKQALCGVNLTLNDGDFCTVIGGNGAGKSTTLNAIAGVWPVDCGQILIDGKDISALPEHKRAPYLGRVFQDPMTGTVADMEIIENLAIAARRGKKRGLSWGVKADERFRYRQMLAEFDLGLEDRMSSKVGLLSGGQRQAITLLMATIKKPKLLLLDEHTAALDPKTAAKVLELSDKIIAENNLTALMVTHNMHDAITHGNRLIMMSDGKIILDISGEEKKNLTVEHLLEMFEKASGSKLENDRMLLSKDK